MTLREGNAMALAPTSSRSAAQRLVAGSTLAPEPTEGGRLGGSRAIRPGEEDRSAADDHADPTAPRPLHVLFVDDELAVRDALARSLRGLPADWRLHFAKDGADALRMLRQGPCHIVVADMRMPGLSGVALLRQIAEEWPDSVRLMLTGSAEMETALAAVNEGHIFRLLLKPCPHEQLILSLELAARQYRLQTTERDLLRSRLEHAQRLAIVGEFTAGVVHDMNNLLAVILNVARDRDLFPAEQALPMIHEAAGRAVELTRELMGFSRRDDMAPGAAVELEAVLRSCAVLLRPMLAHRHTLRLVFPAAPICCAGPAGRIKQIVTNLVINARDAMPVGGEIEVSVMGGFVRSAAAAATSEFGVGNDYGRISVRDSGCGMDATTRQRVFEPFFTTKCAGQGTGLGLSLVQQLVAGLRGWIDVESAPGRGSVFHVFLPTVEGEPTETTGSAGRSPAAVTAPAGG